MISRRVFIQQAAAGVVATSLRCAASTTDGSQVATPGRPPVQIRGLALRDETIQRYPFSGDNWHMSWAHDDRVYASRCDGYDWSGKLKGMHNSRLVSITDGPIGARFSDVASYPERLTPMIENIPRYYGFGTLALDGMIYHFLSTWNKQVLTKDLGSVRPNEVRFVGVKLIYSPDGGRTWRNQDGSSPVVWEGWNQRSKDTLLFWEEDQEAFSLLSVLQMGKNYEHNNDGYIYIYSPNGNTEGTMNEVVMLRVPKQRILDRRAYEFFAGLRGDGSPRWASRVTDRSAVHQFPKGWVNTIVHPFAWQPSVVFNASLRLYMMVNWGTGVSTNGLWFGKPSYLGFWVAKNPWGPWEQIYEDSAWSPAGEPGARAFAPQISPKWIAPDGRSLWLVWSDFQTVDGNSLKLFMQNFVQRQASQVVAEKDWSQAAAMLRKHMPYYAFNAQRFDLRLA